MQTNMIVFIVHLKTNIETKQCTNIKIIVQLMVMQKAITIQYYYWKRYITKNDTTILYWMYSIFFELLVLFW